MTWRDMLPAFVWTPSCSFQAQQLALNFDVEQWRNAIYGRIVAKCGDRRYWETWAGDIADIASAHIIRITSLLADPNSAAAGRFETFLAGCAATLARGLPPMQPLALTEVDSA